MLVDKATKLCDRKQHSKNFKFVEKVLLGNHYPLSKSSTMLRNNNNKNNIANNLRDQNNQT